MKNLTLTSEKTRCPVCTKNLRFIRARKHVVIDDVAYCSKLCGDIATTGEDSVRVGNVYGYSACYTRAYR